MRALWKRIPAIVRHLLAFAVLIGVLWLVNAWVEGPNFNGYKEQIIILCGISIVLAVALNIVNGFTGQFSLGHIGFYAIGAYIAAAFATYGHARLFHGLPTDNSSVGILQALVPITVLVLTGGLAAAVIGFCVGLPSLRLRGDYLAILTLGFAQIIQVVILNTKAVYGATSFTGIPIGDNFISIPHLTSFFYVYLLVAAALWVSFSIRFSTHGLAFLSVREDEIAAEAMGINTTRYKVTAFVLSAFFTGAAGALFALYTSSLTSGQFSFINSINTVVMVVLGGLGSISGAAIAAIVLTVLPEWLRFSDQYRLVVYPLLLVILMLTRPQGIFGREEFGLTWLKAQWAGITRIFKRSRPATPALATGPDVMVTSRDREDTEGMGQDTSQ